MVLPSIGGLHLHRLVPRSRHQRRGLLLAHRPGRVRPGIPAAVAVAGRGRRAVRHRGQRARTAGDRRGRGSSCDRTRTPGRSRRRRRPGRRHRDTAVRGRGHLRPAAARRPRSAGLDAAVLGVPFDSGVSYRPGARFGPVAHPRVLAAAAALQPGPGRVPVRRPPGGRRRGPGGQPVQHRRGHHRHRARGQGPARAVAVRAHPRRRPHHRAAHAAGARPRGTARSRWSTSTPTWTPGTPTSAPRTRTGPRSAGPPRRACWTSPAACTSAFAARCTAPPTSPRTPSWASRSCPRPRWSTCGVAGMVERIRDRVGDRPVYVSVDIDVLDPAHAPGTGTPEAGGLIEPRAAGHAALVRPAEPGRRGRGRGGPGLRPRPDHRHRRRARRLRAPHRPRRRHPPGARIGE